MTTRLGFSSFFVQYSLEQGQPPERKIRELAEGSIDMKGDSLSTNRTKK
jgi:hypothetical protein